MGLAYTNYVCVCCEDANVRMPSRVLVGFGFWFVMPTHS